MSRKLSTEARLLDWIDQAPIDVVVSIMGIANARMKARMKQAQPAQTRVVRKSKAGTVLTELASTLSGGKSLKTDASPASHATAFPGGEVRSA